MLNYFTLLGLEEAFSIDPQMLESSYIQQQQAHHPDRMIGKSEQARAAAIQYSMNANDAYEALKDPLKRAQHLLELRGIIVNTDHDTVQPSPALLMEVMEMREQLSGVQTERDAALVVKDLKEAMKETTASLAKSFADSDDTESAQQTMRLRYLGKSLEEAFGRQYQLKTAS